MEEKDTRTQAERRERIKTDYNGIEGLIQRIQDSCEITESEAEQTTILLVSKALGAGISLEYLVESYISSYQTATDFERTMEKINGQSEPIQ